MEIKLPAFVFNRSKAKHISKATPTTESIASQHPNEQQVITDRDYVSNLVQVERDRQKALKLCPSCKELKDSRNFVRAPKLNYCNYKESSPTSAGTLICESCEDNLVVADLFAGHRP